MKPPPRPSASPPSRPPRARRSTQAPRAVGKPPLPPGDDRPDESRDEGLTLPHERDESVGDTKPEPDPVMVQALKDIESGQVDTDLHNTPGLDAERREQLLRQERGKQR